MTEKKVFVHKLFCHQIFQISVYLCKNCNPTLENVAHFFPATPLKFEIQSRISNFVLPFWKFGRTQQKIRLNRKRASHHVKSQWYSHRPHIFNALVCNEVKINELCFRIQFVCSIFIWFVSFPYYTIQVWLKSPTLDVIECLSHALFLN